MYVIKADVYVINPNNSEDMDYTVPYMETMENPQDNKQKNLEKIFKQKQGLKLIVCFILVIMIILIIMKRCK